MFEWYKLGGSAMRVRELEGWLEAVRMDLGDDPEQYGMSVRDQVDALLRRLRGDAGELPARRFLDCVLVDTSGGRYSGVEDLAVIGDLGIDVVDLSQDHADVLRPPQHRA